jgi:Ser/Thr protein kinase RdoA (MazF antagonist)
MSDVPTVLANYPSRFRQSSIESLGSAGGMSGAQFWRIRGPGGVVVLRRWPKEHPTPERLSFIHSVLAHATARGIDFLPLPITTLRDETFVAHADHLWELEPWLPGTANYAAAPTAEKIRAAMKSLAKFHIAVCDFPSIQTPGFTSGSSAITSRIERLQELAQGGHQELAKAIVDDVWPEFSRHARQFVALLAKALPSVIKAHQPLSNLSFSLQPCIRDIWYENVLFTGDVVTGIVDFGAMDIDTPACDIARLLSSLAGPDPTRRQIGLTAYESERRLSTSELLAVDAFDSSIVTLAGCNWIRWIYVERRQFENSEKILQHFRRIVERTRMIVSTPEDC